MEGFDPGVTDLDHAHPFIDVVFGVGPSAEWVSLIYFLAGVLGTAARLWISPSVQLRTQRMIVEGALGGAAGMILPLLGTALLPEAVWTIPVIYRAAVIFLMTGSGSLIVADVVKRFTGGGK